LQWSVLLGCPEEELVKNEQYFFDSMHTYFNVCKIAGSPRGVKLTDEHKKKLSIAHKGLTPWKNKHHTPESKERISKAKMGHKYGSCPEERRRKIAKTLKGRKRDPEIFKKMWETRRKNVA